MELLMAFLLGIGAGFILLSPVIGRKQNEIASVEMELEAAALMWTRERDAHEATQRANMVMGAVPVSKLIGSPEPLKPFGRKPYVTPELRRIPGYGCRASDIACGELECPDCYPRVRT